MVSDQDKLQEDLNNLERWESKWQMSFHPENKWSYTYNHKEDTYLT